MRFTTLPEWLAWQETLHPKAIDLGLDRIREVYRRLELTRPAPTVITVAGTNGKGSCVVMLDAMLRAAGYRSGAYTSPHLLRYNERLHINGKPVDDASFCGAFERVDQARAEISLSYFEFGTLAAFDLMARAELDVAVLEVGLGGRLDAVNVVDPDCALISTIGVDHTDWLGRDRNSIAKEKAGIMRQGKPVVCGERDPPATLLDEARRIGAELKRLGRDFDYQAAGSYWHWFAVGAPVRARPRRPLTRAPTIPVQHAVESSARTRGTTFKLPNPTMSGDYQLANAACCVEALACMARRLTVSQAAIADGLRSARLPGRFQRMVMDGVEIILDVAHNPQAAAALASALDKLPPREPRLAVFAQLRDKDHQGVAGALKGRFDTWYTASLAGERSYSAAELAADIETTAPDARIIPCDHIEPALNQALSQAQAQGQGRLVVFGSFLTVEAALRALHLKLG